MRWVFLLVLAVFPWLGLRRLLRKSRRRAAVLLVAGWFVTFAVAIAVLENRYPGLCGHLFPGAQTYAEGMLAWVRTGAGCESNPSCFVPQHLTHLAAFLGLTLGTGGFGGLVMATVLFGWMGAYTGGLARWAQNPWAFLAGWHPWALLRVTGFLFLGVAWSEPLLVGGLAALKKNRRWWFAGLVFCLADLVVKWACAETWRVTMLQRLLR